MNNFSLTPFVIPAKAGIQNFIKIWMAIFIGMTILVLSSTPAKAEPKSAYDRVMASGTLRCGYWIAPPMIIKDPNTGKMSGAFVDYVEELGKSLDLKIEWAGEINFGTYIQDINQGKFDAECATGWPNALRGKQAEYTNPVGFMPFYVFVKSGNKKFDHKLEALNDTAVKFAGHDGGTNTLAQQKFFPQSQLLTVPGDAPQSEPLNMIKYGKADATLVTSFEGLNYSKENPDSIRQVISEPVRIIPMTMTVGANEFRLLNMLNTATNELLYDGTIESIYKKYDISPNEILRVAKPYEQMK